MVNLILTTYQRDLKTRGFIDDPDQKLILEHLARLHEELICSNRGSPLDFIQQAFRRLLGSTTTKSPKGLYLWGPVGRGKTCLMDLFYECLPFTNKRRVHFHRFMLELHDRLESLGQEPNSLARIARDLAKDIRILCLDELFVSDIGDAMILTGLFRGLIDNNVVLVITSNTNPKDLYQDGLQRQRFLPTISLIEENTEVIQLKGKTDHRLRSLTSVENYLVPHDENAKATLTKIFHRLAEQPIQFRTKVNLKRRSIETCAIASGIIWFDFNILCRGHHSKVDFAELSQIFHTLVLSDIPILGSQDDDTARRFLELVDELYDRRVNLVLSAAAHPEALYGGKQLKDSFQRAASRLREMQSKSYVTAPHRP